MFIHIRIHKHQLRIPFLIQSLQHRVHLKRLDPQNPCRMLHHSFNLFSQMSLKLLRFCLERVGSQQIQTLWNSQKAQEFQEASMQLWDSSMQTNSEIFDKILNFLLNSQELFA